MIRKLLLASLLFVGMTGFASAQTVWPTPGGAVANGAVGMCLNAGGNAVPCPSSATITGNATGTTGAVVGTLAAAAGETTYICGFDVSAFGGTATIGPITVAGLVGSSMKYEFASAAAGATLSKTFSPCIPASAVNTAITVTTTADGTATEVDVNTWGYQQ